MKNKVKIFLLVCLLSLAFTGCGGEKDKNADSQGQEQQTEDDQAGGQPAQDESEGESTEEYEESDLEL